MHLGVTDDGSGIGKVECIVNGNKLPENQIEINQLTEAGVTYTPVYKSGAKGTVHAETIAVTANVKNGESRIRSYAFQISTTSANTGFTTKETIDETGSTCPYIYEGLTPATKYYLRVIVTDNVGNKNTGTAIEVQTYCKTTYCAGGTTSTCTACGGNGKAGRR